MRYSTFTLIGLCMVMAGSPVLAKEKKVAEPDMQAMMETYKKLATPGEPHKQLASLAGSWTTKTIRKTAVTWKNRERLTL